MAVVHMGKSSTKAWNPNRPMSSLLAWQIEHLYEAEKRLPHRHHTEIYVNAIKTEGEAAEYIQKVTEAIHKAHAEAEARRMAKRRRRPQVVGQPVGDIAAAADEAAEHRPKIRAKKKSSRKPKKKK